MRILALCTYDQAGGAEKVAFDLCRAYRDQGHDVRLLVREKRTGDHSVFAVSPYRWTSAWAPVCEVLERWIASRRSFRGQRRLQRWLQRAALPQRWIDLWRGIEDFNYPYSYHLTDESEWSPDVIHVHNLHGDYFDLRALPILSQQVPFVWTLHDTWAFTGHCAHFIDCERWRTGCGDCPDLGRPPAVRRDRTAENWERKRQIYSRSKLAVATPSRWLMNQVMQSMLHPWQAQVVPNGVDLTTFKPGDRRHARAMLELPPNSFVCMFISYSANNQNPYKDFATLEHAVQLITEQRPSTDMTFLCVGANAKDVSDSRFFFSGYVDDPSRVALYYQSADVLVHAANAENFPGVVLEALACGVPVVATAVGGIPEQVLDGEVGFLVPRGDWHAIAQRVLHLIDHADLRQRMGQAAAAYARRNYSLDRQVNSYLEWFEELTAFYKTTAKTVEN